MDSPIVANLRDGRMLGVSIEYIVQDKQLGLAHAAGQMVRHYGVPFRSSNTTGSNAVDTQATYENAMSLWGTVMDPAFEEELAEVLTADTDAERIKEIGDLIFVLVNWLRWLGLDDPESLLRAINAKFYRRFCHVEQQVAQSGKPFADGSLDELEAWWQEAKRLTD